MKKIIIILFFLTSIKGISQTPGFKIINSEPIINISTKRNIFLDSIKLNYLKGERKPLDSIFKKLKNEVKINSKGSSIDFFSEKKKKTKIDSIKLIEKLLLDNKKQQNFLKSQIKNNKKEKNTIFNTPEIIDYNYLKKEKKILKEELTSLKNILYINSIDQLPNSSLKKEIIKEKKSRIKYLRKKIDTINFKQDSLYHIYTKDFLQYKKVSYFSFGPKRTKAFFDILNGNTGKRFRLLNNTGFNIGNSSASIYSEIASGNLGILRVSLGAMISSSSSDSLEIAKKEEAYQRLVTSGGNTVLKIEYPLAYLHSRNNQYNFISRLIVKGSADFPELGTNTEKWAGSGSFGLDFFADASLDNNSLRFFINYNINTVYGTSTFIDNLDISKSQFTLSQLTLGLVVMQNVKLSFIIRTWSSAKNLENSNVIAGGQFLH